MRDVHSKKPEECQYSFTQHKTCEFFPCHKTEHPEDFNCLFCYCPLYTLGEDCGGNFSYTAAGIKNCSGCNFPHKPENYRALLSAFPKIAKLAEQKKPEK